MKLRKQVNLISFFILLITSLTVSQSATAAIALDRTRIIFNGDSKSVSVNIRNDNEKQPYLAQAWVEDENGHKIQSPLMALPPLQRLEHGAKSLVKLQLAPGAETTLPQDKESLFYFNLREIPPRSQKSNVLQLALQTRVKLFYRPDALVNTQGSAQTPWQEKLELTRRGDRYRISNPTPYYITLVAAENSSLKPLMLAPRSSADLGVSAKTMGKRPRIAYINDWGGRPVLTFDCHASICKVSENKAS